MSTTRKLPWRRSVATLPGVVLICVIAGCGAEQQPMPPAGEHDPVFEPPPPLSAGSETQRAGEDAAQAYLQMWRVMARAGETSDWREPDLAQFATGNALTTITRSLFTDQFNHVVTRGMPVNAPQVTSVEPADSPEKVMISDCGDSTRWLKYRDGAHELIDDEAGGRQSILADVAKQSDGSWRVNQFAVQGVGTC